MGDFCVFLSPSCFPYRQYHCILDGSLELDVQTRLDLDSPEIHLPPDLRCAPPCVLTSLLFLSVPRPHACQTCVKCWASYMLGKQFLTRLHSWRLLSSFIHPLLWSWLLNSLGSRVFLSRYFTLSFISSAFNLSCSVLPC